MRSTQRFKHANWFIMQTHRHGSKNRVEKFRQNHGIRGVVYILENPGLRAGLIKIGCSRRSGRARAMDLNRDANTGTPGSFRCVFECQTEDCGHAEEVVFRRLAEFRQGKWGQEFFDVSLEMAKQVIVEACREVDCACRNLQRVTPATAATSVLATTKPDANPAALRSSSQDRRLRASKTVLNWSSNWSDRISKIILALLLWVFMRYWSGRIETTTPHTPPLATAGKHVEISRVTVVHDSRPR